MRFPKEYIGIICFFLLLDTYPTHLSLLELITIIATGYITISLQQHLTL